MSLSCRENCGACCIAASISQPLPGMPEGKPAGVPCVNLDEFFRCKIFNHPARPLACELFLAEPLVCGENREQALHLLTVLEQTTSIC